jgi:hypothetical protein
MRARREVNATIFANVVYFGRAETLPPIFIQLE